MSKIANLGPRFLNAIKAAEAAKCDPELLHDAIRLENELSGKSGEGALEVFRDLAKNICSVESFINRWSSTPDERYRNVLLVASEIRDELVRMQELVDQIPKTVLEEIKKSVKIARYDTLSDEEKYGFKGNNIVMLLVFGAVFLIRYLGIINLSWYVVFPLALGAAVIVTALISTILFFRRGH